MVRPLQTARNAAVSALAGLLVATLGCPTLTRAAPPSGDEWSIEARDDDAVLVRQRLAKLHAAPFDGAQWRALERAIGHAALVKRLLDAARADPDDPAWAILAARAQLSRDDAAGAASTLAPLTSAPPPRGRARGWWAAAVELRVDALLRAERPDDALAALEGAARRGAGSEPGSDAGRRALRWYRRALEIAKASESRDAVARLGATILDTRGSSADDALAVARAASALASDELSARAFTRAETLAKGRARAAITLERAAHDVRRGEGTIAADALWSALTQRGELSGEARTRAYALLEEAHRVEGTLEALAKRLDSHVADDRDVLSRDPQAFHTLARAREDLGQDPVPDLRRALELVTRDAARRGELDEARGALVQALERRGELDEAMAIAAGAGSRRGADTSLALAERLLAAGQRAKAISLLETISRDAGRNDELRLRLVDVYNELGERERALAELQRVVDARPRDPEARIALGDQLFELGRIDEAFAQWRALPKLVRPSHAGWARLAEVLVHHQYARTRPPEGAPAPLQAVEKALALRPSEPTYLRLRAVIHEERREADEALDAWDAVRRLADAPHERPLRDEARTRVVELVTQGNLRRPRQDVRAAYLADARARIEGGELEEVQEWARFAAELHARENQHQSALDILEVARERFPDDVTLLELVAQAQRRAGRLADATQTLGRVAELAPEREASALANVAEWSVEQGATVESLRAAKQAAARDREGAQLLLRVGELHQVRGALEAAADAYEAALAHGGARDEALLRIGELAAVRGELDTALTGLTVLVSDASRPDLAARAGRAALTLLLARPQVSGEPGARADDGVLALLGATLDRLQRDRGDDEVEGLLLDILDVLLLGAEPRDLDATQEGIPVPGSGREGPGAGNLHARALDLWWRADPVREARLRTALLQAVVGSRLEYRRRAATQLGIAELPGAGAALVRFARTALPAHDAPRTVILAHRRMRTAAIVAAGRIDDADALDGLERTMKEDADGALRRAAAWALASSDHPRAVLALEAFVRGDPPAPTATSRSGGFRDSISGPPATEISGPRGTGPRGGGSRHAATRGKKARADEPAPPRSGPLPGPEIRARDISGDLSPIVDPDARVTTGGSISTSRGSVRFDVSIRSGGSSLAPDPFDDSSGSIELESRLLALACIGISRGAGPLPPEVAKALRVRTARAATSVRHACALPMIRRAMSVSELARLIEGGDPVFASVAFDRWLELTGDDEATRERLWTLALGPAGHLRDRARRALDARPPDTTGSAARGTGAASSERTTDTSRPSTHDDVPWLERDGWSAALQAWFITPSRPVALPHLHPSDRGPLVAAAQRLRAGGEAQRAAIARLDVACARTIGDERSSTPDQRDRPSSDDRPALALQRADRPKAAKERHDAEVASALCDALSPSQALPRSTRLR